MNIKKLANAAPWEWPEDAGDTVLATLRSGSAKPSDRLLAAELAGEIVIMNDGLAEGLLTIVESEGEPEDLRSQAAISLGPLLEDGDVMGFDESDDVAVSEETFLRVGNVLRRVFDAPGTPRDVKRSVLEASVRAPKQWHEAALRNAYAQPDRDWRLTALFGMGYVPGFDTEIVANLDTGDAGLRAQAIEAAGNREIQAAWPFVVSVLDAEGPDKDVLLAAIDAAAIIRPEEAEEVLTDLLDSDDEDVSAAADEAIMMARGLLDEELADEDAGDEENEEEDDDGEEEDEGR
jgi:hypothetical protein